MKLIKTDSVKSILGTMFVLALFSQVGLAQPKTTFLKSESLTEEGYPKQQKHNTKFIKGYSTKVQDKFTFQDEELPITIPDTTIVYGGDWVRVGTHRVAAGNDKETVEFSTTTGISEETTNEASIGLSSSVTAGVKPFGLGVDVTIETSVNFSKSITSGKYDEKSWSVSVPVQPGTEVQIWTRVVSVDASWSLNQMEGDTDLEKFYHFQRTIWYPSVLRHFQAEKEGATSDIVKSQLSTQIAATKQTIDEMPASFSEYVVADVKRVAAMTGRYNAWLKEHKGGKYHSSFKMPAQKRYTVKYKIPE